MFASFVDLLQSIQQFVAHFCEFIYVLLFSFCIHFALQRQLLTHTYINAYCRIRELQCARFFQFYFQSCRLMNLNAFRARTTKRQ